MCLGVAKGAERVEMLLQSEKHQKTNKWCFLFTIIDCGLVNET